MRHAYAQATALADAGYPVYGIEYRRTGKSGGGWPMTCEDIQQGISTVILQLPSNTGSVHIVGHSAGGHLALLAASSLEDSVYRDINITVHGLAPIVPATQAQHPDATTIPVAGAGHFDWIHPQSVASKQWLQ